MMKFSTYTIFLSVLSLLAFGIIAIISAEPYLRNFGNDNFRLAKHHITMMSIAFLALIFTSFYDYKKLNRYKWAILILGIVMLTLCFVPNVGNRISNSSRWINARLIGLESIQIQPSEFARLGLIIFLASWYGLNPQKNKTLIHGFLLPCIFIAIPMLLIYAERDVGSTLILISSTTVIMLLAQVRYKFLIIAGSICAIFICLTLLKDNTRMQRIIAFYNPKKTNNSTMYQQNNSVEALGYGGLLGKGLGKGEHKRSIPYAHTDFIFPIIGEELGLFATAGIATLFFLIFTSAVKIATSIKCLTGTLLVMGIASSICTQAFINIAVAIKLIPNSGMPLPFISYGGSNLLATMIAIGIIFSVYNKNKNKKNLALQTTTA